MNIEYRIAMAHIAITPEKNVNLFWRISHIAVLTLWLLTCYGRMRRKMLTFYFALWISQFGPRLFGPCWRDPCQEPWRHHRLQCPGGRQLQGQQTQDQGNRVSVKWIKLLFWPKEYLNMWGNQFQSKTGSLVMPLYFTATRRRRQKRTRRRPTCPSVWRMWKGLTVEASASRLISAALINLVKKWRTTAVKEVWGKPTMHWSNCHFPYYS